MITTYHWKPQRVFFETEARRYELGEKLYSYFTSQPGVDVRFTGSHNRVTGIPGKTAQEAYLEAKRTLAVGVRKSESFQTCKPSAHYQLPLVTSCPGQCEYCYLNTTLGKRPYIRVYVNLDEIFHRAKKYIQAREPEVTLFEGAATSDPLPVEEYTGALAEAITFFAGEPHARFRFVSKFPNVDTLLDLDHQGHTEVRFSINTDSVVDKFERGTPRVLDRIEAAGKVARAEYPVGFLIAPVFAYEGWEDDYRTLVKNLAIALPENIKVDFEIILHRYTTRAKNNILERNSESLLPMDEEDRVYKYGQFGYGKYIYPKDIYDTAERLFRETIPQYFPYGTIKYIV